MLPHHTINRYEGCCGRHAATAAEGIGWEGALSCSTVSNKTTVVVFSTTVMVVVVVVILVLYWYYR
jgi:uncharacterized membrane protein YsdA (DUF1294 family)